MTILLRCMVYRTGKTFTAECVDLDLMTRAKTAQSAREKLNDAMLGYLLVALAGDPTDLIPRPSPFKHRLRFENYGAFKKALREAR